MTRSCRPASLLLTAWLLALVWPSPPAPAAARPLWGWPLPGTPHVDRPFEPPSSPWGAGHRGVDLRGELGELVLSAGPGRVSYAGVLAGRGVITVTHDGGLRTTYEPVSPLVADGQRVEQGQVLGRLGLGHASCGTGTACLHWGLLRGSSYLDPLSLLARGQVRLLPYDGTTPSAAADHAVGAPSASALTAPAGKPRPTGRDRAASARAADPLVAAGGLGAVAYAAVGAVRRTRRAGR